MTHLRHLLSFFALLALAGCTPPNLADRFADKEAKQIAEQYIQRLVDRDFEGLLAELDAPLKQNADVTVFQQMRDLIPSWPPDNVQLVGYRQHTFPEGTTFNLTYQYRFGDQWMLINAGWRTRPDNSRVIIGLRIQPLPSSLQELHAFNFRRAGVQHYVFLAAAFAIPCFIIATLIVCIRAKWPRRKWAWILFLLVGFVQFSLNWTTGEITVSRFAFLLGGVGFFNGGAGTPWMLHLALPLGALLFWLQHFRHRSTPAPSASTPANGPTPPPL